MTVRRVLAVAAFAVVAVGIGWLLFVGLPRWYGTPLSTTAPPAPAPGGDEGTRRTIKARLYYVSDDGTRLTPIESDVLYAERTAEQARHIVEAQLAPAPAPLVSAVPEGTALRALYVTDDGAAFVDLSASVAAAHPGGSLNELLTIYTLVQALTTNIPAITSVQLLVDGKEVDTLAGHVDVKRPLPRADEWVAE
jgi:spore germination protein GerM